MTEILTNFVTVLLGSGAAIAITRLVFDYKREKKQQDNAEKYLALRLVYQLEGYAIEAANMAQDHRLAIDHNGEAGKLLVEIPFPQEYPSSDAYQLIKQTILNDLFDFPQRCRIANKSAIFTLNVIGDPDLYNESLEGDTIVLGHRALEIAHNIRQTYRLGDRQLRFGAWDVQEFFNEKIRERDAKCRKRRSSQD